MPAPRSRQRTTRHAALIGMALLLAGIAPGAASAHPRRPHAEVAASDLRVSAPSVVRDWETALITVTAAPFVYTQYARLQRFVAGTWRNVPGAVDDIERDGMAGSHSPARLRVVMDRLGDAKLRVRMTSEVDWYRKRTSAPFTIHVTPNDFSLDVLAPGVDERSMGGGVGVGVMGVGTDISADGRYAVFTTDAALDPYDRNGAYDVYWRDLDTGRVQWVSRDLDPNEQRPASRPALSADGRYVVYLVSHHARTSVYYWDAQTGTSSPIGVDGERGSVSYVSADGRWVLVDTPGGGQGLWDAQTHAWESLMQLILPDTTTSMTIKYASLSADGRWIGFAGFPWMKDPDSQDSSTVVYLYDRETQTLQEVERGDATSILAVDDHVTVSADGGAAMYAVGSNSGDDEISVRHWTRGAGPAPAFGPLHPSWNVINSLFADLRISGDGSHAVFEAETSDLWPESHTDENGFAYLWSAADGTIQRIPADLPAWRSSQPSVSADGARVVFSAFLERPALVPVRGRTVFVWTRQPVARALLGP